MSAPARVSPLSGERRWWLALGLVTAVAAVLRLIILNTVPDNLFYDAAVRSMTLSLHNFIYGAFDPSAATSIDKPPIDLWLQVISVKLFGWSSVALKLPEAIAGTAAVPLLYDLVRRIAGPLAALGSAITLALLPTSVITARSDTMDSVMMLLLVAVAWLLVRSVQRRDLRLLLAAAVLLGIDFNVKLFEALVPVPAFLVFVWLCWRGERVGVRLRRLAAAGALFAAVALSWMVIVSLTPAHDRPYAIGSTNGSVWNSVFVFDGWDRIFKPAAPRSFSTASVSLPVAHAAAVTPPAVLGATTTVNSPPGPFRLFQYSLVGYGTLIGTVLFAAIVFGLVALGPLLRRRLRPPPDATREQLIAWAATLAVALWLLTGYVLFSFTGHTQPRYLEAFTPAVAIALGAAIPVVVSRARDLFGAYVLIATFAIAMLEGAAEDREREARLPRDQPRRAARSAGHPVRAGRVLASRAYAELAAMVSPALHDAWHAGRDPRPPGGARRAADPRPQPLAGGRGHARLLDRRSDLAFPASASGQRSLRVRGDGLDDRRPADRARPQARDAADDGQLATVCHARAAAAGPRRRPGALCRQPRRLRRRDPSPCVLAGDGLGAPAHPRHHVADRAPGDGHRPALRSRPTSDRLRWR